MPAPDFSDLIALIHERRARVARLVNRELIELYWDLGAKISHRVSSEGWGKGTVTQLADPPRWPFGG